MSILMQRPFETFALPHLLAIFTTVVLTVLMTRFARTSIDEKRLKTVRHGMGFLLLLAVALDPVLTLIRYGWDADGWAILVDNSLPFYLCDVVSIVLAIALFTGNQRLAEIGYLWGLAGTVQGLLMPTLWFDHHELEFYVFFLQHGGAPLAAVFLVWGVGLAPQPGAFRRAVLWSLGYLATVMSINLAIGENYGFLNGKPEVPTFFDHMGPWPYYLITLQVIAYSLYALLLAMAPSPQPDAVPAPATVDSLDKSSCH